MDPLSNFQTISFRLIFHGTNNIYITCLCNREIMHAMWQPKVYKYVYLWTVGYVLTITMPHCIVLYSNFGDELLNHSNALSVLPHSVFRSIALCFMIGHQVNKSNFTNFVKIRHQERLGFFLVAHI